LTLRLRIGRKGYIILPKAIREAVGLDEGDEVLVEVKDGIILKPAKKFERGRVEEALKRHLEKLEGMPSILQPKLGELSETYLEEEFET